VSCYFSLKLKDPWSHVDIDIHKKKLIIRKWSVVCAFLNAPSYVVMSLGRSACLYIFWQLVQGANG
jgi:hypothetical protein